MILIRGPISSYLIAVILADNGIICQDEHLKLPVNFSNQAHHAVNINNIGRNTRIHP